jgi:hypothetical protein
VGTDGVECEWPDEGPCLVADLREQLRVAHGVGEWCAAERDELADWILGADHHPGCNGPFPGYRCKCGRDEIMPIVNAYLAGATAESEVE